MYSIKIVASARKVFARLDKRVQQRVSRAIRALASEPRSKGATKLSGVDGTWRKRVEDYRVIYKIEDDILVVLVVRIAHRKDAYR